jgi:hypothetical protein
VCNYYSFVIPGYFREIWYFGLEYTDKNNNDAWLPEKKKIKDLDIKKEEVLQFRLEYIYFQKVM